VAIVMDGNGRWAEALGLPRRDGHRAGASAVRRTVTAAAARGIGTLTLYAFSSDNWRRPPAEVRHLMRLFRMHLHAEGERCEREGVRVSVIGRRDRLAPGLVRAIEAIESRTAGGARLHLQLAIDYSARDALVEAARLLKAASSADPSAAPPAVSREAFTALLAEALNAPGPVPDVDLLVRTGGEQRLSDFMLWECAYAELVFTPCLWPDFDEAALDCALETFGGRERRFGALPAEKSPAARRPAPPLPLPPNTRVVEARTHG
jgi:undecaprenyl diphosphate synthase